MTEPLKGIERPLVDPKSFELAEHFLSDLEGDEASEDQWQNDEGAGSGSDV